MITLNEPKRFACPAHCARCGRLVYLDAGRYLGPWLCFICHPNPTNFFGGKSEP